MKSQLLQTLSDLGSQHPEWLLHSLTAPTVGDALADGRHCAEFSMGNSAKVWVSLLGEVASTDVVRQGLMAHQLMQDRTMPSPGVRGLNLVVIPGLDIQSPVVLTTLVMISALSDTVLTECLHRIAQCSWMQTAKPER